MRDSRIMLKALWCDLAMSLHVPYDISKDRNGDEDGDDREGGGGIDLSQLPAVLPTQRSR